MTDLIRQRGYRRHISFNCRRLGILSILSTFFQVCARKRERLPSYRKNNINILFIKKYVLPDRLVLHSLLKLLTELTEFRQVIGSASLSAFSEVLTEFGGNLIGVDRIPEVLA